MLNNFETTSSIIHRFTVGEQKGYFIVTVSEHLSDMLMPSEVFIHCEKVGEATHGLYSCIAQLISAALSGGVPLVQIVRLLENNRFQPAGITRNSKIPMAKSVIDYLARWLEERFLK